MKFQKALLINISESALDKEYWELFDELIGKRVSVSKDSPDILKELPDADCIFTGFGVLITKEMIDVASNLKYIGAYSTAYGRIDIGAAAARDIPVTNLAGYSTESVAEFTIAILLEHIRDLETGKVRARKGEYSEEGINAREIRGSVFGVIGLGHIGNRVAELAHGFGAQVKYWSHHKKDVSYVFEEIDTLLAECDFLSLHLAEMPETDGFLDAYRIEKIKKGAVVINTAPMELVDISALENRLKKGDITFILDHSDEMSKEDLAKLSAYKNCIIYPPIAYITSEARKAKQEMFISNINNFLEGHPTGVVNQFK